MATDTKGEEETATNPDVTSEEGMKIYQDIKLAYSWKDKYTSPNDEFMSEMTQLISNSQVHLTKISSTNAEEYKKEADAIVNELISLRQYLGPSLFPSNMTALLRERIYAAAGPHLSLYRIDCIQFFEPVPYRPGTSGIMKLYQFSVYDDSNKIVIHYILERSDIINLYHVLCFADGKGSRGQLVPYHEKCPSYWELKDQVLKKVFEKQT